ncbi:hypothetical protein TNCV_4633891 [Trichonephila clavipes]|nr:hypothetical protein TNCV_4633891 [Trichonephila clavipes]
MNPTANHVTCSLRNTALEYPICFQLELDPVTLITIQTFNIFVVMDRERDVVSELFAEHVPGVSRFIKKEEMMDGKGLPGKGFLRRSKPTLGCRATEEGRKSDLAEK